MDAAAEVISIQEQPDSAFKENAASRRGEGSENWGYVNSK